MELAYNNAPIEKWDQNEEENLNKTTKSDLKTTEKVPQDFDNFEIIPPKN